MTIIRQELVEKRKKKPEEKNHNIPFFFLNYHTLIESAKEQLKFYTENLKQKPFSLVNVYVS